MSPINSLSKGYNSNSPKDRNKIKILKKEVYPLTLPPKLVQENNKKPKRMSNSINSLAKGYTKAVKNTSPKKSIPKAIPLKIKVDDVSNKIKMLHADGNLTKEDINILIKELQTVI